MSNAGANVIARIWRYSYNDDQDGGALATGTILYSNIPARIDLQVLVRSVNFSLQILEQGLETPALLKYVLYNGTLAIQENDEIEVTAPATSQWYGKRLRITIVQPSSIESNDPRSFIGGVCRRLEVANAIQS